MFVFSAMAFPLAQTPSQTPSQTPRSSAPPSTASQAPSAKAGQPSAESTAFVKDAAGGGMTEVRLADLASSQAQRDDVKELAKMIKGDHERANQELKSLASSKQIALPTDLSATQKATVAKFEKLNGAAFDKAYIDEMVKDHRTDIAKFKKHSSDADADLAAFVTKTLPALEKHLSAAEQAQKGGNQAPARNGAPDRSDTAGRSGR